MLDKEAILKRAIEKAIAGGWNGLDINRDKRRKWPPEDIKIEEAYGDGGDTGWTIYASPYGILKLCNADDFEDLIFNHDFAKALWKGRMKTEEAYPAKPYWEYHLQQMVIADDPIAYLMSNI